MDETGLIYSAMPARLFLAPDEDRVTVRGTKALKAMDRVTLIPCCYLIGIVI